MTVHSIFKALAAEPSRNAKIEILKKHGTNALFVEVVSMALNPFIKTGQRKLPIHIGQARAPCDRELAAAVAYLPTIFEKRGTEAVTALANLLNSLSECDAEVIGKIVTKDLACGANAGTVNTAWPNTVFSHPVMLCSPFDAKLVDAIKYPAIVQTKMDGMRVNVLVNEAGQVSFFSRSGKMLNLLGCLEAEFKALADGKPFIYDGEMLVASPSGGILDRQTGNGILNKANKGTITAEDAAMIRVVLWDSIPYADWVLGVYETPYRERLNATRAAVAKSPTSRVAVVDSWVAVSSEEVHAHFDRLYAEGQEGIILKDMASIWEDKRSRGQIKFKGELECELIVTAVEEGNGKYAGMLGAVYAESSDGVIKVRVGSGFDDAARAEGIPIGSIISVKYNARTKNKRGEESLFLPIFIEVRHDKSQADSNGAIA